jgi:hypothetical protein
MARTAFGRLISDRTSEEYRVVFKSRHPRVKGAPDQDRRLSIGERGENDVDEKDPMCVGS